MSLSLWTTLPSILSELRVRVFAVCRCVLSASCIPFIQADPVLVCVCVLAVCQQLHNAANAGLMRADTVTEAEAVCVSGLMSPTLKIVIL